MHLVHQNTILIGNQPTVNLSLIPPTFQQSNNTPQHNIKRNTFNNTLITIRSNNLYLVKENK